MSASRNRLTLNAHFVFGETESFDLWVSSSPTRSGRNAFADALALDPIRLKESCAASPLPVAALTIGEATGRLDTEPRLKLETLADMIRRAASRNGQVSLSAYRE